MRNSIASVLCNDLWKKWFKQPGHSAGNSSVVLSSLFFLLAAVVELSGLSMVLLMPVQCGLWSHYKPHKLPGEESCCNSVSPLIIECLAFLFTVSQSCYPCGLSIGQDENLHCSWIIHFFPPWLVLNLCIITSNNWFLKL